MCLLQTDSAVVQAQNLVSLGVWHSENFSNLGPKCRHFTSQILLKTLCEQSHARPPFLVQGCFICESSCAAEWGGTALRLQDGLALQTIGREKNLGFFKIMKIGRYIFLSLATDLSSSRLSTPVLFKVVGRNPSLNMKKGHFCLRGVDQEWVQLPHPEYPIHKIHLAGWKSIITRIGKNLCILVFYLQGAFCVKTFKNHIIPSHTPVALPCGPVLPHM